MAHKKRILLRRYAQLIETPDHYEDISSLSPRALRIVFATGKDTRAREAAARLLSTKNSRPAYCDRVQ